MKTTSLTALLFACSLLTSALAFDAPITVPGAPDAASIAAVSDKAGRIHAITTTGNSGSQFEINYHLFNGDSWKAPEQLLGTSNEFNDPALTIDDSGTLHLVVQRGVFVDYYSKTPTGLWGFDTVASDARETTMSGVSIDTRTSSNGTVTRYIAYTGQTDLDGGGTAAILRYAVSSDGMSWTLSTANDTPGSGRKPSISAGAFPLAGLTLGSNLPVIAYTDAGSHLFLTYLTTTFVIGGGFSSTWSTPMDLGVVDVDADDHPLLIVEKDAERLHVLYEGAVDGASHFTPAYYRRSVSNFLGSEIVTTRIESIIPPVANSRESEFAFRLDQWGVPQAVFTVDEGSNPWRVEAAVRRGTDDWETQTILAAPLNEAGQPRNSALVADPIGRITAMFARENNIDTAAVSQTGTAKRAVLLDTDSSPAGGSRTPQVAPDGSGGAFVAFLDSAGQVRLNHIAHDGRELAETVLDDGFTPPFGGSISRSSVQIGRFDSGRVAVYYLATIESAVNSRNYQGQLFIFDGETEVSRTTIYTGSGSVIGSFPQFDMEIDGDTGYLCGMVLNGFGGGSSQLKVFDHNGTRDVATEAQYTDSTPEVYIRPQMAVSHGDIFIMGQNEATLAVSKYDRHDNVWTHNEQIDTFTDAAAVPDSYDIVVIRNSELTADTLATAVYSKGSRLYLAHRVSAGWSPREIDILSGVPNFETDTAFVTLENGANLGEFHLGLIALKGSTPNTVLYAQFQNPGNVAVDISTFLEPEQGGLPQTSSVGMAIDQYGLRYLTAVDQSSGELALSLPAAAADSDGDGAPLFIEYALCTDPDHPDSGEPLSIDVTAASSDAVEVNLGFTRPEGLVDYSDANLSGGIFDYQVERGFSVDLFNRARPFLGLATLNRQLPAASQVSGAVDENFLTETMLSADLQTVYFRLRVSLRKSN